MSKPAKPEKPAAQGDAPPKSKKKLVIIIAAVLLLVGGGAAAFLLMKPAHPPKAEEAAEVEAHIQEAAPKFVELGTFTANLRPEEGDRYLQVAISLKITDPELEVKIKASNPEIMHRVNLLLQSKLPSELGTFEGKNLLAEQIKGQVEYVLGLRKTAPVIAESGAEAAPEAPVAEGHAVEGQAAEGHAPAAPAQPKHSPVAEVLFTSFIIQ